MYRLCIGVLECRKRNKNLKFNYLCKHSKTKII
jgi:hypothetical protein